MGKNNRLKLGILFNVSRNWLGGVYYIINLIKALNTLDDTDKPELVVLYSEELKDFTGEIDYPYLSLELWDFETPLRGYLKSWVKRRNVFSNDIVNQFQLDGVYPEWNQPLSVDFAYDRKVKSVSWFADLQHKYYPEFFSSIQLIMREARLQLMLRHTNDLVVSSKAARDDFKKFYSLKDDLNIHVLNFVSIIDDFEFVDFEIVREKYGLPEHFYMISNQFHKHKNHSVLLKALVELKKRNAPVHYAITGRMPDQKDSEYIRSLHELINKHNLDEYVSFLGVVPRQEQLSLMKHSTAVIQPSLFEGWSTVIEDAKSLQVPVIAANLDVNIEQLGEAGTYFDPHDENELANILSSYRAKNTTFLYADYQSRVKKFAEEFICIFR